MSPPPRNLHDLPEIVLFLHREEHPIRPPKSILVRILSSAGLRILVPDIVLLRHLPGFLVHLQVSVGPIYFNLLCQIAHIVILQPLIRYPLKGGPTVGGIPLLSRVFGSSCQSAWLKEFCNKMVRHVPGLSVLCQSKEERKYGGQRELRLLLPFDKIVIKIKFLNLIPSILLNGGFPLLGQRSIMARTGRVVGQVHF